MPIRMGGEAIVTSEQLRVLNQGHVLRVLGELAGFDPRLSYSLLSNLDEFIVQGAASGSSPNCSSQQPEVVGKRLGKQYIIHPTVLGHGTLSTVKLGSRLSNTGTVTNLTASQVAVKVYHISSLIRRREFHRSQRLADCLTGLDKVVNELWLQQQRVVGAENCVELHDIFVVTNARPSGDVSLSACATANSGPTGFESTINEGKTRQQALISFARRFPQAKLYLVLDLCSVGPIMLPTRIYVPNNSWSSSDEDSAEALCRPGAESASDIDDEDDSSDRIRRHEARNLWVPAYQSLLISNTNTGVGPSDKSMSSSSSPRTEFKSPISSLGYCEELVKCFIRDAATALSLLHAPERRVAHRDVKPCNLLLCSNGRLKLGDFNVASFVEDPSGRVFGTEGTYHFLPPECCAIDATTNGQKGHTSIPSEDLGAARKTDFDAGHDAEAADVWALGVTLWVLLLGTLPFCSPNLTHLFQEICQCNLDFMKFAEAEVAYDEGSIVPRVSPECIQLLKAMLEKDPQKRPKFNQILESNWIANVDFALAARFAEAVLLRRKLPLKTN